jgi:hypothetical protein
MELVDEGVCRSCFNSQGDTLGVDINTEHDTWTFKECGHTVCEAQQNLEECDKHECSVCKPSATKKDQLAKCSKDALLMQDLLGKVESDSAKSLLTSWLEEHGSGVGTVDADAKAGTSTQKRQKTK